MAATDRDRGAVRRGDGERIADEIDRRIRALPEQKTEPIRRVRREYSKRLRAAPAEEVLALALALVDRQRWVAYELLYHHPGGLAVLDVDDVERLGRGMDDWGSVDAFGGYISGSAWRRGRIPDDAVRRWAACPDRWWRRAALVATVALNVRSRAGTGDTGRTLDICARLAADRDDMVVKALSWALRELVAWDPAAVRGFLEAHDGVLASRVTREVGSKLETGRKHTPRPR
ncbi:MAG TPA: DNA alkylation repair protein [Actinomycetota bacterium]|nr:DNA alkylation repair protein [Actinomycetota bacterium]